MPPEAVILRKTSQSNRSEKGATRQTVLMSIYRALKLGGLNPIQTLADALPTCLLTDALPPPPAATAANG